eukprot:g15353.t1
MIRGYPTLWVLLVLSIWESPSLTTVNAFVGLATRSAQQLGGRSTDASAKRGPASRSRCPLRTHGRAAASSSAEIADTAVEEKEGNTAVEAAAASGGGADTRKRRSRKKKREEARIRVTTADQMRELLSQEGGKRLLDLDARGDSQAMLEAREDEHPVLEALRNRLKAGTKPGSHEDGLKVGLAIEGGGMRGCVSAGMIAAVVTLGLMDTFDAVYGSSAGSLVGAYAIAGQEGMPRLGCSVYYDTLTGTGRHFIDTRQIFRSMGLGLLGTVVTRWRGLKELVREKWGSPVLNLNYLLHDVVERQRPLDWDGFWKKQATQPLHVIASGVTSEKAVVLTSRGGHFKTLRELTECMRASMLLPGITGPMVTLPNVDEQLVDSQLYQQIPFQTAIDDGCTHVLVLRSRPDGTNLLGKPKIVERLITHRFFKRKSKDPVSYKFMKSGGHKKLYAESVLTLNEAAAAKAGDAGPYLMPMCLPAPEPEVGRLERGRENILEGVRKGYEHAHLLLRRTAPQHPTAGMDGREAALEAFPDSILAEEMDPVVKEILERSAAAEDKGEARDQPASLVS